MARKNQDEKEVLLLTPYPLLSLNHFTVPMLIYNSPRTANNYTKPNYVEVIHNSLKSGKCGNYVFLGKPPAMR